MAKYELDSKCLEELKKQGSSWESDRGIRSLNEEQVYRRNFFLFAFFFLGFLTGFCVCSSFMVDL